MIAEHPSLRNVTDGICVLILVLAVWACFLPVLDNDFVHFDDLNFLGAPLAHGLSGKHLRWMWSTFAFGNYYPITWMSKGLDYLVWNVNPFGYHLTSLMLHTLTAGLWYGVLLGLLRRTKAAAQLGLAALRLACLAGALVFAIHPLRVESVAWLSSRGDVVCGVFYCLTILAYLRLADAPAGRTGIWWAICTVCFALSLLSRAWGITLPVVLLVLDIYPLHRLETGSGAGQQLRRLVWEKAPFAALAAGAALLAYLAKEPVMFSVGRHGILSRAVQSAYGLCLYLGKTFWPIRLSPLYILPADFQPTAPIYLLCLAAVGGLTLGLIALRRRWPWALAAWLVYVVIVSPLLGLVQSGPQIAADRYTYLACLPFSALAAAGLLELWRRQQAADGRIPRAMIFLTPTAAVLVLIMLGILTARQTLVWRDTLTLWTHAIRVDPRNGLAYHNRGHERRDRGDFNGALDDYSRAITCHPRREDPYNSRATLLQQMDRRLDDALADYNAALCLNPGYAITYNNRGTLFQQIGNRTAALADYDAALRLNPGFYQAYENRAMVRRDLGDIAGALTDINAALALQPAYVKALFARGLLHHQQGDFAGAETDYSAVLELEPDHREAHYQRGTVRLKLGLLALARADYNEALRRRPDDYNRWHARGILNGMLGAMPAAAHDLRRALDLAPPDWPQRASAEHWLATTLADSAAATAPSGAVTNK